MRLSKDRHSVLAVALVVSAVAPILTLAQSKETEKAAGAPSSLEQEIARVVAEIDQIEAQTLDRLAA